MRLLAPLLIVLTCAAPLAAQTTETVAAAEQTVVLADEQPSLDSFLWEKRPIVVFAESENDLLFRRQMELLEEDAEMLAERDVVVLTDTDPDARSPLRQRLRPRGFQLVLVGKDGHVKLRKPRPWTVREISRVIDKMPMRQQEIRQRWER